ncbi:MAG: autotransporter outer membrane beta-barrel domain-containing protein [Steroidobacteraceae bacterium]
MARQAGRGAALVFAQIFLAMSLPIHAQSSAGAQTQGSLAQLVDSAPPGTFNQLEQLSAAANQASYNLLTANPDAAVYCNPEQRGPSTKCSGETYLTFSNLRILIQSSNELLNNGGPTFYSLHTSDQGLGFALRWTAGENLSAPGSVATQFANGQLSSVLGRIEALRLGASGFAFNGVNLGNGTSSVASSSAGFVPGQLTGALGGGASADSSDIGIASRWGGFLNGAYGWGYRQPSVLESAFAFDSSDATLGLDYRFTRRLVVGVAGAYTNQRVDFDSQRSVAGGGFRAHGYGVTLYGLYEWEGPYISASASWQRVHLDESRLITYPSFNIAVPSVDVTARGSTSLNSLLATFGTGWSLNWRAFTAEPYLNASFRRATLDGFSETSTNNAGPDAGQEAGFGLSYAPQLFRILDISAGLRLQYAFKLPFLVAIPYVRAAYHRNLLANDYTVSAAYDQAASDGSQFDIPSDPVDNHYAELAGGFSVVLPHGIQGFAQYQMTTGMQYVVSRQISAGIRAEF